MSNASSPDTVVVGAGQAGLAMSRWLQKNDVPHVVLERDRVGSSWVRQRWDSFHLNTPNAVNMLPEDSYEGDEPMGFAHRDELVRYFEEYRRRHDLPLREGAEVSAVRKKGDGFEVETSGELLTCRNVVLCSGDQNSPKTPEAASQWPGDLAQLHTADYRRPAQLPDGAVLVVGSGQSGVQIVEDLLEAGRQVYVCTSFVGRVPRRYRGKDLIEWFKATNMADHTPSDLEDPGQVHARQPQISGTRGGHTVSLQQLARDGAKLLGRYGGVKGRVLQVDGDLEANVAQGDAVSNGLKEKLDGFIQAAGVDAPTAEPDPIEAPFDGIAEMAKVRELDLDHAGIGSVIWSTGFGPSFSFLDAGWIDEHGRPRHTDGVCDVPGLYCLGFVWLRRRISGLVVGVDGDAERIAAEIVARRGP